MIKEVISIDMKPKTPACDVIIEWAEETAKYFNAPFSLDPSFYEHNSLIYGNGLPRKGIKYFVKSARNFLGEIFPVLRRITNKIRMRRYASIILPDLKQDISSPLSIYYLNTPQEILSCASRNSLPVFIDAWTDSVKYIADSTRNLQLFYVTSRRIFDLVRAEAPNSNVRYMPLSVSDKYFSPNFEKYRRKTVDVIQFGRKDSLLHKYMLRYAEEHKDVEYVYVPDGSKHSEYISTKRRNIGKISSRDDFINTLASAKISIISSPGMNKNAPLYYKVSFPTPRFYESAILGCSLIGRYPDNQEFRELNMSRYCPNITSYDQFVHELERALAMTPEELYAQNHDFILNSLTSKRAERIQKDLEELTCQNS